MTGLAASVDRLTATIDDTKNKFVEANSSWLTSFTNAATKTMSWLSTLDNTGRQVATFGGAAAALAGGAWGFKATLDTVAKLLGTKTAEAVPGAAVRGAAGAAAAGEAIPGTLPAFGGAAPAALGVAAGALATVALHEALGLMADAGIISPTSRPDGKPGHWEIERNGRGTSRRWVPDSLFDRPATNAKSQSWLHNWWNEDADPWAHKRNSYAARQASEQEIRALGSIAAAKSSFPALAGPAAPAPGIGMFDPRQFMPQNLKVESEVHSEVKGEVELHQTIAVDPSPMLLAKINEIKNINIGLHQTNLGETMKGSNAAKPSAFAGFKPTASGF